MDIYAEEGTKVIVTEDSIKNGYDLVEEHARKFLKVGKFNKIKLLKRNNSNEIFKKTVHEINKL